METQIDDQTPQAIAYVMEQLFALGALDVFTQAIGMKKSRQAVLLTVLCEAALRLGCEDLIFRETTTLGIRRRFQERVTLSREILTVQTAFGSARVKVARRDGAYHSTAYQDMTYQTVQPEYEDCARLARDRSLPFREVYEAVLRAGELELNQNT